MSLVVVFNFHFAKLHMDIVFAVDLRPKTAQDSEQEGSEDNEDEWTYPEARNKGPPKKLKKEKVMSSSPLRSGRGPGRPPKHQHKELQGQVQHGSTEASTAKQDFLSIKVNIVCVCVHRGKGGLRGREGGDEREIEGREEIVFVLSTLPLIWEAK